MLELNFVVHMFLVKRYDMGGIIVGQVVPIRQLQSRVMYEVLY